MTPLRIVPGSRYDPGRQAVPDNLSAEYDELVRLVARITRRDFVAHHYCVSTGDAARLYAARPTAPGRVVFFPVTMYGLPAAARVPASAASTITYAPLGFVLPGG